MPGVYTSLHAQLLLDSPHLDGCTARWLWRKLRSPLLMRRIVRVRGKAQALYLGQELMRALKGF